MRQNVLRASDEKTDRVSQEARYSNLVDSTGVDTR